MRPKSLISSKISALFQKWNLPFLFILGIELFLSLELLIKHRITTHDTLSHFISQYYFLNNVIFSGEIPQWIPYLTHGTTASWWSILEGTAGFLHSILLYTGGLLKSINFFVVYNIGMYFEKLLLIVGVWLLSERYYTSKMSCAFVAITVVGSSIWLSNIQFNFHFFYAIPLILYFGHKALDNGCFRSLFFAINLYCLQAISATAYFIPVSSMTIFFYFLFFLLFNFKETKQNFSKFKWDQTSLLYSTLSAASVIVVYLLIKDAFDPQLLGYYSHRSLDGTMTLDGFLTYGTNGNVLRWFDLLLGSSTCIDYTLYIGLLPVLMLVFLKPNKTNLPIIALTVMLFLFSISSVVSTLLYHLWPLMEYYRHLAFSSSIVRLFLCFLAGFGFENLFIKKLNHRFSTGDLIRIGFCAFLMLLLYFFLKHLMHNFVLCKKLMYFVVAYPFNKYMLTENAFMIIFRRGALYAFGLFIFLIILPYIKKNKQFSQWIILLALCLHVFDIYSHKHLQSEIRTVGLNKTQYRLAEFKPPPFIKRRIPSDSNHNLRDYIFAPEQYKQAGEVYWHMDTFFFKDQLDTVFRTPQLNKPLDHYLKAYAGQYIHDISAKPNQLKEGKLTFPVENSSASKISGFLEDKIQFFSKAIFLDDDSEIAKNLAHPKYKGDILFLSDSNKSTNQYSLSSDHRLYFPYKTRNFSANRLEINIMLPSEKKNTWMLYSDVWHPSWRALINDKETKVYQANLAYKAIRLEPGENKVEFIFKSNNLVLLQAFIGLNSLFWLLTLITLAVKIAYRGQSKNA